MELDQLNRTQHELKHGSEQLEDILKKLEKEQVKFETFFVSSQVYLKWVIEIEKSDLGKSVVLYMPSWYGWVFCGQIKACRTLRRMNEKFKC